VFLLVHPALAQNQPMTFRVAAPEHCRIACPAIILAEGLIVASSADEFRALVQTAGRQIIVHLNSPGGSLIGGMQLGTALRDVRATVAIAKNRRCVSACVYALLGGVVRRVEAGARIGVHRFHALPSDVSGDTVPPVLARYALDMLTRYAERMGADPALVALAAGVAPDKVRYLSKEELRSYRLVTPGRNE